MEENTEETQKNGSSINLKNYLLRSEDLRLRRYERSSESMEDREDDLLSRLLYLFKIFRVIFLQVNRGYIDVGDGFWPFSSPTSSMSPSFM